ncbi:hypothetical protein [Candidatus Thiodiazotropha sp. LNASS1]|uniref:hypothetical protein n=1 Tax=Candidatus Thiodiazotropha sp. LNASS1 TaxID=3096260 RepID=UPI0034E02253
MMTQGWVVKGPAKRFSSTGDYIAGSFYRVMPPAPDIVLCRIVNNYHLETNGSEINWKGHPAR